MIVGRQAEMSQNLVGRDTLLDQQMNRLAEQRGVEDTGQVPQLA